ncbi:MAG: hypothetical protein R2715_00425 [Ilumatobacteraceae bacterium]
MRGIHPAVLEDRGLDAALSGLVARCPTPVQLQMQLPDRPASEVELAAYFFVGECLTNVAKHAGAESARVIVDGDRAGTRVTVWDDGRGGAVETAGGGLDGLRTRVGTLDGTVAVTSPVGGPTTVSAWFPAARGAQGTAHGTRGMI